MNAEPFICERCHTLMQGRAKLCIRCFAKLHKPCPRCMIRRVGGTYAPRHKPGTTVPVDCGYCNNERWIVAH